MKEIQLKELARCIKFIEAVGCQYKIVTDDGQEFGNLETKPVRTRRPTKYPYGTLSNHIRQHLKLDVEVGNVQEVPVDEYDPAILRSGVCAILTKTWGLDTYITNKKETHIEILRTH